MNMAIRTKEELFNLLKDRVGEDTSDESLAFLEDVQDTVNDLESRVGSTDWKQKYEDNDKMWRDKYKQRFFSSEPIKKEEEEEEKPKKLTFEDLFKEA